MIPAVFGGLGKPPCIRLEANSLTGGGRSCLAVASGTRGARKQIATAERWRDGSHLHGGGFVVSEFRDGTEKLPIESWNDRRSF
jgi:hypothetical protein